MGNRERKDQEKLIRKNDILKAAEALFFRKGYENTTMDEIAGAAEYTKRTIYQYFPAKEDIYFALASKAFGWYIQEIESIFAQKITGLDKLRKSGEAYRNFYLDSPDSFLIMCRARNIHSREEESIYHQEIIKNQQKMFELFGQAFAEGKEDGSIRKDVDIHMSTLFMISSTISLFTELAENKERLESMLGISVADLMSFSLARLTESFRP